METWFSAASIRYKSYLLLLAIAIIYFSYYPSQMAELWAPITITALSIIPIRVNNFGLGLKNLFLLSILVALGVIAGIYIPKAIPFIALLLTLMAMLFVRAKPAFFCMIVIGIFLFLFTISSQAVFLTLAQAGFIWIAGIICILAQTILYPRLSRNESQFFLIKSLTYLKKLNAEIFACYIYPEYNENIYLFEHRIRNAKIKSLQALQQLENIANQNFKNETLILYDIFNILMDMSQLRRRVGDHSSFGLCKDEIIALDVQIQKDFIHLLTDRKSTSVSSYDFQKLENKIDHFEDDYHHVLRVSTRDPLVFLLFISSLKSLHMTMNKFATIQ